MIVITRLTGQCEYCGTAVQLFVTHKDTDKIDTMMTCPVCVGYADEHLIWLTVKL